MPDMLQLRPEIKLERTQKLEDKKAKKKKKKNKKLNSTGGFIVTLSLVRLFCHS